MKIFFHHLSDPAYYEQLKSYAKKNRDNITDAEKAFWYAVKGKALGYRFNRQFIIGDFIVDFVCLEKHLVVEIDGGYHSEPLQMEDDKLRQEWLEKMGYHVIRFKNEDVLTNITEVISQVQKGLIHPDSF